MTEQTLHENAVNGKNFDDLHGKIKAILNSDLSDGAKLSAIALELGARTIDEVAATVNRSSRTVERHYAEARKHRKLSGTGACL